MPDRPVGAVAANVVKTFAPGSFDAADAFTRFKCFQHAEQKFVEYIAVGSNDYLPIYFIIRGIG